jgi:hypothetical protein
MFSKAGAEFVARIRLRSVGKWSFISAMIGRSKIAMIAAADSHCITRATCDLVAPKDNR